MLNGGERCGGLGQSNVMHPVGVVEDMSVNDEVGDLMQVSVSILIYSNANEGIPR